MEYCADQGIEFTRSRAYRKNGQAWIEQKNGSVVRRFAGHERYSGQIAGQTMVQLYQAVKLHVNYFQTSFKLREKIRDGARVIKRYSPPATPCDRVMQGMMTISVVVTEGAALNVYRAGLDPVALLSSITGGTVGDGSDVLTPAPGKLLTEKALTGFWPAWPACGNRAKHDPRTRREFARPGTGVPGRIPSKACGATCFCDCRKTQTATPRTCWQNYARPIRAGSATPICERCSAG